MVGRLMGVAALIMFVVGCTTTGGAGGVSPSASVTTAIQGWEHYFKLDWTAEPKPNGTEIGGYVYNNYGAQAVNVQILAQGLDEQGNLVGQKLEWVQGGVPPLQRSFFKVAGLPPAPRYRVAVWAFDWVQSPKMDP
jgi:hypothetical protein